MDRPIGVFDSGVGGLTVLASFQKELPNENLIYIGDNLHCPYGDKTKEQLFEYTCAICEYFISRNVKMIVLACNTTSANVLDELREKYKQVRIVGVISSTVHDFLKTEKQNVLVIATKGTIASHKYKETIYHYDQQITTYELATPLIVPLVESGEYKKGINDTLTTYLSPYKGKIDSIILGCTHYPVVMDQIQKVLGDITYISSSAAIYNEVHSYLILHQLENKNPRSYIEIYTTGHVDEFKYSSEGFFDYHHLEVQFLKL